MRPMRWTERLLDYGAFLQRKFLLRAGPPNGICAEIGVFEGSFSSKILRVTRPATLHLIDPGKFEDDPTYHRSRYGGTKEKGDILEWHEAKT